jgi:hypothetical protein
MTGERVTIERHKWPDVPHYEYDAVHLGDDEHGSWFAAPVGNDVRRAGAVLFATRQPSLYLLPAGGKPWMAWFGEVAAGAFDFDVYVDVGTVPVRTPGRITMVDLDLDVVRRGSGSIDVLDEDELVLHATAYGYPPELVDHARAVAAEVVALLEMGDEPFAAVAESWKRIAVGVFG